MTRRRRAGRRPAVKIAKADLVPADANLLPEYGSFAGVEGAWLGVCGEGKAPPPRVPRRPPAEMLAGELARLHPVPAGPFTVALAVTRKVDALSLVTFDAGQYPVPHQDAGRGVRVRRHGDQVVIT